ncbi:MBL fold metallo-hydrolase [Adhaeribacter pallidiroseus]|uniref:Persulfide dioxygenase n=1 Tax=Adhaeribacter pallidiroseus TaxID=2072847 RepID=A0A369QK25_9BACT|nr:MBL fold metallo-hydrolase [Adhaeribacter pallidiroseus]RDC64670.1 Persulfide dioxygenase [Adhaeribacter pallidiroseus]
MIVTRFTFNAFAENTYVLHDETKACLIVDPGCYDKSEQLLLSDFIKTQGLQVTRLINTHCHIDHVLGNKYVVDTYQVDFAIHEADLPTLRAQVVFAPRYGITNYEEQLPTHYLTENESVRFGNTELQVLFTPGHAPGHVVFYHEPSGQLIGGDVLFQRSIGRTDLPGGNYETLLKSIKTKLFPLPDATIVYPGHGPNTTIGEEKKHNPFLR